MNTERCAPKVRFFIIGVPKAGTTALCEILAQHPQIFMCPIKEPTFFAKRELLSFELESRRVIEADDGLGDRGFARRSKLGPSRERRHACA